MLASCLALAVTGAVTLAQIIGGSFQSLACPRRHGGAAAIVAVCDFACRKSSGRGPARQPDSEVALKARATASARAVRAVGQCGHGGGRPESATVTVATR